jgi:hypothetical protein
MCSKGVFLVFSQLSGIIFESYPTCPSLELLL